MERRTNKQKKKKTRTSNGDDSTKVTDQQTKKIPIILSQHNQPDLSSISAVVLLGRPKYTPHGMEKILWRTGLRRRLQWIWREWRGFCRHFFRLLFFFRNMAETKRNIEPGIFPITTAICRTSLNSHQRFQWQCSRGHFWIALLRQFAIQTVNAQAIPNRIHRAPRDMIRRQSDSLAEPIAQRTHVCTECLMWSLFVLCVRFVNEPPRTENGNMGRTMDTS